MALAIAKYGSGVTDLLQFMNKGQPRPWKSARRPGQAGDTALLGFQLGLWAWVVGGVEKAFLTVALGQRFIVPLPT